MMMNSSSFVPTDTRMTLKEIRVSSVEFRWRNVEFSSSLPITYAHPRFFLSSSTKFIVLCSF